jgi:hypothetical protein
MVLPFRSCWGALDLSKDWAVESLALLLIGFGLGYTVRELISRNRRKKARRYTRFFWN